MYLPSVHSLFSTHLNTQRAPYAVSPVNCYVALVPHPETSSYLDLLGNSTSSTQGVQQVLSGFTFPALQPRNSLKAVSLATSKAFPIFSFYHLLGIIVLHCFMSNVLKSITSHILPNFLVVSGRRVNLVSFTSFYLEVELLPAKTLVINAFQLN